MRTQGRPMPFKVSAALQYWHGSRVAIGLMDTGCGHCSRDPIVSDPEWLGITLTSRMGPTSTSRLLTITHCCSGSQSRTKRLIITQTIIRTKPPPLLPNNKFYQSSLNYQVSDNAVLIHFFRIILNKQCFMIMICTNTWNVKFLKYNFFVSVAIRLEVMVHNSGDMDKF